MHPSEELRAKKSSKLIGKTIVLGITGSIAATECVKLCHELIRHGARVVPVMTESARKIIHEDALEYATGEKPITSLTGKVEHVYFCGEVPDRADLYLIAPATANTIGKIAHGIDDTPVTTFATTALGSGIPIMVVPAMHSSMYRHPVVIENIEKLKKLGLEFVSPRMEEMRVKWPGQEIITTEVIRKIGKRDMTGIRILIICGPTREPIDEVRAITNKSTGRSGIELAREAYMRGANVEIWYGKSGEKPPQYISSNHFETVSELVSMVENMPNYDVIVNCAAISDYTIDKRPGKISSENEELILKLKKAPKINKLIRKKFLDIFLVGYKAEVGLDADELTRRAKESMCENKLDIVVANDFSNVSENENSVQIISMQNIDYVSGKKSTIAEKVMDKIVENMNNRIRGMYVEKNE